MGPRRGGVRRGTLTVFTVGVDMGGTFTDGYATDGVRATVCKVPTTHFDLSRSVIACLRRAAEWFDVDYDKFLGDVDVLRVATTIGTNAVVEGTGDTLGVIVERGAERTLYARSGPAPAIGVFVEDTHVRGVEVDGDAEEVLAHCRDLVALGVRRIVVSFRRDHHRAEARLRSVVGNRYPEHYLRSIPLSIASEVAAVDDDEMRTNTALVNAYVSRPMGKLLYRTEGLLQQDGLRVPLLAVRSDASCGRVARTTAIATYSSGPAGGLALVARFADEYGDPVALGFDMGGTTLDLGLVRGGRYAVQETPEIRAVRIALPVPRIVSVGLGGSSIAVQHDGVVTVGPQSAGAVPGPACFGRGGTDPTLTDADVVLGFVGEGDRFGGEIEVAGSPAREVLESVFRQPADEAARRVRDAAHRKGAGAVARLLADAGVDPSDVTLYAFGGAGALHAHGVAELLGVGRIRSFAFGSVFSARGVAGGDLVQVLESRVGVDDQLATVARLTRRAMLDLEAELLDGGAARFCLEADAGDESGARTVHEGAANEVTAAAGDVPGDERRQWRRLRLTTVVPAPLTPPVGMDDPDMEGRRVAWWGADPLRTPLVGPARLARAPVVQGPALVHLTGVVHAVPPGWTCRLDETSNLLWVRS